VQKVFLFGVKIFYVLDVKISESEAKIIISCLLIDEKGEKTEDKT
jgi:hypothetical protein